MSTFLKQSEQYGKRAGELLVSSGIEKVLKDGVLTIANFKKVVAGDAKK